MGLFSSLRKTKRKKKLKERKKEKKESKETKKRVVVMACLAGWQRKKHS